MIPRAILANACADTYRADAGWDTLLDVAGVHAALRRLDEYNVLACRGSFDLEDWLRDFKFFGLPTNDADLGAVHAGMVEGVDAFMAHLLSIPDLFPLYVVGHSLGAAHALFVAGKLVRLGRNPSGLATWGTPQCGMDTLTQVLKSGGFPIFAAKNGPDPVCDVPVRITLFGRGLNYQRVVEPAAYDSPPTGRSWHGLDKDDPLAWHSFSCYNAVEQRIEGML
jgi:hypothetical protein